MKRELTWKLWTLGVAAATLLDIGLQRLHTHTNTESVDSQAGKMINQQAGWSIPQQGSENDVGSLQVHQVVIIILIIVIIILFLSSSKQATAQTSSLFVQ